MPSLADLLRLAAASGGFSGGIPLAMSPYPEVPPPPRPRRTSDRELVPEFGVEPPTVQEQMAERMPATDAADRLTRLGLSSGNVTGTTPLWGSGYISTGASGGRAQSSPSSAFGVTGSVKPGAFDVGAVDPRQQRWASEFGAEQAARRQREYSDWLDQNATLPVPDRMRGVLGPSIMAERARGIAARQATSPIPGVSVANPEQVAQAAQQATEAAANRARTMAEVATEPTSVAAGDVEARQRAMAGAAPYAMNQESARDARSAFLQWLFPQMKATQGATPSASADDLKMIAAATGVPMEEIIAEMRKAGIQVQ
jgi:hypothetical protein